MNYFEHHIGDYDRATAHLSAVEDGIYSRMIRWYMASEAPLPVDIKAIQRRVRARTSGERAAVQTILDEFFKLHADGYHQQRCDEEVARYRDKQSKAKRSANARWNRPDSTCSDDANAMRTHDESMCTGDANGMHRARVPKHQTPDTKQSSAVVGHQQTAVHVGPDGPARADVAEQAAKAMESAGLVDVSASHPKLRALVLAGLTVAELTEAARAAAAGGKGFPWALARAEGQRRDAAQVGALPDAAPAVDPDSRGAIEADGERFGLGRWQQVDAQGNVVPWTAYAERVRGERASRQGVAA